MTVSLQLTFAGSVLGLKPCVSPVDVAFLMDSSGSIKPPDYQREKDFVKLLADRLDISPNHSRAAIVLYSGTPYIEATFDSYTNARDFGRAVNNLRHLKSTTRIDKALELAATDIFSQARDGVAKIAIVLTDGQQSDKNKLRDPAQNLRKASEPLRSKGVRVLAVGIGHEAVKEELRLMTEADTDVFMPTSFDDLKLKIDKIREIACG